MEARHGDGIQQLETRHREEIIKLEASNLEVRQQLEDLKTELIGIKDDGTLKRGADQISGGDGQQNGQTDIAESLPPPKKAKILEDGPSSENSHALYAIAAAMDPAPVTEFQG